MLKKALLVFSDILLILAIFIGLYIVYQVFFTDFEANQKQSEYSKKMLLPDPPIKVAEKHFDKYPVIDEVSPGEPIAKIYIPKLSKDYWRVMLEGAPDDDDRYGPNWNARNILDNGAYLHYHTTALPGQIGNFAASGHRSGFGSPLARINDLVIGDKIVVRTAKYWFVYRVDNANDDAPYARITDPLDGSDLYEVPRKQGVKPTERLLTFTTCHPFYSDKQRYILHGRIDYWANVKDGIPQEMIDAGFQRIEDL